MLVIATQIVLRPVCALPSCTTSSIAETGTLKFTVSMQEKKVKTDLLNGDLFI